MPIDLKTSPKQFADQLARSTADLTPAEAKPPTATELLAKHKRTLLTYRAKGYSLEQLQAILHLPEFGIDIGTTQLARFLKPKRKRAAKGAVAVPSNAE